MIKFLVLSGLLFLGGTWFKSDASDIFPGDRYDAAIPTLAQTAGFDFGKKITMHHEALGYAKALAAASPKVSIVVRGKTWEEREMALLFITSEANQKRLKDLQKDYQAIADPRKTDEAAFQRISEKLPVQVLLQESVHGNEISGTDSGLFLAWRLAAAVENPEIEHILENGVLVIEVMQNPDGRDRFVSYSRQHRSPGGDPDPQAAERSEGWPSGRFNHYLFDMNRDWFAMTQLETRTKVASFLEWYPQVVVDLHEMGSESSFFAAKPSPPANPILPRTMHAQYEAFGRAIGAEFDKRGYDYFHGETFDSFYPGYGESWPSLQGAIGVLFEQASARGLQYQRRDGTRLTHHDAMAHQAVASYALLRHAVDNRKEVLAFFYKNRKDPLVELRDEKQVFLLPGQDLARAVNLGRLLQRQGIEVEQISEPIRGVNAKLGVMGPTKKIEIPSGSLSVRFDQPAGRLARSLLLPHLSMDEEFIKEQQKRIKNRKRTEIYDITAWSLPLLHGVPAAYAADSWKGKGSSELKIAYQTHNLEAKLGYLIPSSLSTGPILAELLQKGVRVSFNSKPIRHKDIHFPNGSLIVQKKGNGDDLPTLMAAIAKKYEATVFGVDSSWFESGPSFGSGDVVYIKPPRVALLWNSPTNPMSAGWMRYLMEQRFGYPVTALKVADIGRSRLEPYDVVLMPEGYAWDKVLGKNGTENLKNWIQAGGVLVAVGASTEWLAGESAGLLQTVRENRGGEVLKEEPPKHPKELEKDSMEMLLPQNEQPARISGVLLNVTFDTSDWVTFGMPEQHAVLVDSNRIFRPLRFDAGNNPGRFGASTNLYLSGYANGEALNQFAHKPFLMTTRHGRGLVIAFTEDPNYRAFMDGLSPLLANAIFFGPSQTR